MRIETHGDTVSFDGGTMGREEAMQFALDLANAAWAFNTDGVRENRLAFTTVRAAAAIKELHSVIYVYGNHLGNPDVNAEIYDRQVDRMARLPSPTVTTAERRRRG